jgi:hypothetical protein
MGMFKAQDSDADLYGDIGYSYQEYLGSEDGIKGSIPFISTDVVMFYRYGFSIPV